MDSLNRNLPAAVLLIVVAIVSARAQMDYAPTCLTPQKDTPRGTLLKVWITALDGRGRPVLNLTKGDLKLYEDNVERQIDDVAAKDSERLTVRLLVDASVKFRRPFFRPQLTGSSKLLRRVLDGGGHVCVAAFGERLSTDVQTSDLGRLEDSVHQAANVWLGGKTALFDAIDMLCRNQFPEGRKALVVVSDANDTGSRRLLGDAVRTVKLTRTQVYFLVTVHEMWERFVEHQPWMMDARDAALRLASSTGGKVYRVHTEAEVDRAFEEIAGYLTSEYAVTFYSVGLGSHRIRVQSARRGVRILSQQDYPAPQN